MKKRASHNKNPVRKDGGLRREQRRYPIYRTARKSPGCGGRKKESSLLEITLERMIR